MDLFNDITPTIRHGELGQCHESIQLLDTASLANVMNQLSELEYPLTFTLTSLASDSCKHTKHTCVNATIMPSVHPF